MTRTDYDYEPNTATASTPAQIADRRRAAVKPEVDAFVERIEAGLLTSPSNANGEHWFSVGRVSRDMIEIVAHSTVHGASDAVQLSSEAPDFCCVVVVGDDGRPTGEIVGEYPTGKSAAMFIIADEAWESRRDGMMTFTFCAGCDRPLRVTDDHPPLNRLCCSDVCMARLTADESGWQKVVNPQAVADRIAFEALSAPWKEACALGVTEAVFIPRKQAPVRAPIDLAPVEAAPRPDLLSGRLRIDGADPGSIVLERDGRALRRVASFLFAEDAAAVVEAVNAAAAVAAERDSARRGLDTAMAVVVCRAGEDLDAERGKRAHALAVEWEAMMDRHVPFGERLLRIANTAVGDFIYGHAMRLGEQSGADGDELAPEIHHMLNSLRANEDGEIFDGRAYVGVPGAPLQPDPEALIDDLVEAAELMGESPGRTVYEAAKGEVRSARADLMAAIAAMRIAERCKGAALALSGRPVAFMASAVDGSDELFFSEDEAKQAAGPGGKVRPLR